MNNERKYNVCEIADDLLPLYVDGACSNGSREFIEDHVKECENCRNALARMQSCGSETALRREKISALRLHGKKSDGGTLKSILLATVAAYVPLVFIAPLFASDTGLAPTNYPFRLLVVFLYTLPILTASVFLGFTALTAICGGWSGWKMKISDVIGWGAFLCTLIGCFDLSDKLYLALFGSAVNMILWIITALKNRKTGKTVRVNKKIFFFGFFAVFTAFLLFIIAFTTVVDEVGKRPERDEYETLKAVSEYYGEI